VGAAEIRRHPAFLPLSNITRTGRKSLVWDLQWEMFMFYPMVDVSVARENVGYVTNLERECILVLPSQPKPPCIPEVQALVAK
jgi:hypothetical protein